MLVRMSINWSSPTLSRPAPRTPLDLWDQIGRVAFDVGPGTRWVFRGMSSASHHAVSSLARRLEERDGCLPDETAMREAEVSLLTTARGWGIGTEAAGVADDMYVLALMQHHGLPTRLLDVTANPLTALYFACKPTEQERGGQPPTDGVLLGFNVTGLPAYQSGGPRTATYGTLQDPIGWYWENALAKSAASATWFLVEPSTPDHRMRAQEGLFLTSAVPDLTSPQERVAPIDCIYQPPKLNQIVPKLMTGVSGGSVEGGAMPGPAVWAVIIPAQMKTELRQALGGRFNRSNKLSMFPDLMGLRDALLPHDITVEP